MATIDVENNFTRFMSTFTEWKDVFLPAKPAQLYTGEWKFTDVKCVWFVVTIIIVKIPADKILYQARSTRSKRTNFSKFSNLNNLFTYHFGAEDADIGQFWWFIQTLLLILKNHFFIR